MSALALHDVSKSYGAVRALRGVSLDVNRPGLHCLAGPNGSGKSTLLAVLLGLTPPDEGRVERRVDHVSAGFQSPSVYPDLTVDENLRVFAAFGDAGPDWIGRVRAAFGLDAVRDQRPAALSGGYRRLLDVGLAFVRRPPAVVLDEPLDELDGDARERVVAFARDYRDAGNAVLVSTHRLAAFDGIADHLTVLADGRVVHDGAPDDSIAAVYRDALGAGE